MMTTAQMTAVRELRAKGYAVIIWTPDEVGGANPRKVEDSLIEMGWDVISDLGGPPVCGDDDYPKDTA